MKSTWRRVPPAVVAAALLGAALVGEGIASAASCAGAASGGEWRSYGHDLSNSRNQDEEHDITPLRAATLRPVWTFSSVKAGGTGDFTGTPVVADGCVYVASNGGWVYALNAETGEMVWQIKLDAAGTGAFSGGIPGTVARVRRTGVRRREQASRRVCDRTGSGNRRRPMASACRIQPGGELVR
jgi:glucose dehydrogenase